MSRRAKASAPHFDPELDDLPPELRWREWMARVEAVIIAAPEPVPRAVLSRLVGQACRLDDIIADLQAEFASRASELVFVAGGWRFRTRPRLADAVKFAGAVPGAGGPDVTPAEQTVLAIIAYHQPITRMELSRSYGKEVSRDLIGRLRDQGLIAAGPRAPEPGAPYSYVTTDHFLDVFDLGSLRDLPDLVALEEAGLLVRAAPPQAAQDALDAMLALPADDQGPDDFQGPGIDE